jgi:hypothetical protein
MARHEIDIEVRTGGEVHVSIRGVSPKLCGKYKEFFTKILQATDEDEFVRIMAPHELKAEQSLHQHLDDGS